MSALPKRFWILTPLLFLLAAGGAGLIGWLTASAFRKTPLGHAFKKPRAECSWTVLPDGRLLMAGGIGHDSLTTVECFDPKDGAYHADGSLKVGRCMHSAVLLADGRVLLAGGLGDKDADWPTELEIYDPATHDSRIIGRLKGHEAHPAAVLLKDDSVFIAGLGYGNDFATRFDPSSGKLESVGSSEAGPMAEVSAVRLDSGAVLVTGSGPEGRNAFLYDPVAGTFSRTGPMHHDRFDHTGLLLQDGRVFIAGGYEVRACELYDPKSGTFSEAGELPTGITKPHAALLPDGKVLVVGGREGRSSVGNEACLFDPATSTLREIAAPQGFFLMSGLLQRPDGSVWLVSDTGAIAKFNPKILAWN